MINARRWEQYTSCPPSAVPDDVIWTETDASRIEGGHLKVSYGGPPDCAQRREFGAPFRRLYNRKTRLAFFFVYSRSPRCEDTGRSHEMEPGADGWPQCKLCGSTGL